MTISGKIQRVSDMLIIILTDNLYHRANLIVITTGMAQALVTFGWTMLIVLHLPSCYLLAHIMDLGTITVSIQRMWLFPVQLLVILILVSDSVFELS